MNLNELRISIHEHIDRMFNEFIGVEAIEPVVVHRKKRRYTKQAKAVTSTNGAHKKSGKQTLRSIIREELKGHEIANKDLLERLRGRGRVTDLKTLSTTLSQMPETKNVRTGVWTIR